MKYSYTQLRNELNRALKEHDIKIGLEEVVIPLNARTNLISDEYEFIRKDDPNRIYQTSRGQEHTGKIFFTIHEYKDQELYADLFMACFINDYFGKLCEIYKRDREAIHSLEDCLFTAKRTLNDAGYGLWHHACKEYFLWLSFKNDEILYDMMDKKISPFANESELAQFICESVKDTFSEVKIRFTHNDEEEKSKMFGEIMNEIHQKFENVDVEL